jgi:UDP-N-acetylglucosamine:LPS N-acetylglucosamine transferase
MLGDRAALRAMGERARVLAHPDAAAEIALMAKNLIR